MALGAANQKGKSAKFHISAELNLVIQLLCSLIISLWNLNFMEQDLCFYTVAPEGFCSVTRKKGEIVAQTRRSVGWGRGTAPRTEQSRSS